MVPLYRLALKSRLAARRGRRAFFALAPLIFAFYLAGYLVAEGQLLASGWAAGEHLTPEQWAQHQLLDRLGLANHHGRVEQGPVRQATTSPERGTAVLQPAVAFQITLPPTVPAPSLEGVSYLLVASFTAALGTQSARRLWLFSEMLPKGLSPAPPEKPPPFDR